jgi:hypothetical protein
MNRTRIAVVAALALLAQTLSTAWAFAPIAHAPAAAAEVMPCHAGETDTAPATPETSSPCTCCDADCAFACVGAALASLPQRLPISPPAVHAAPSLRPAPPLAAHAALPFRPPAR